MLQILFSTSVLYSYGLILMTFSANVLGFLAWLIVSQEISKLNVTLYDMVILMMSSQILSMKDLNRNTDM